MLHSEQYTQWMSTVLKKLCDTPSPSGFTDHISKSVCDILTELGLSPEKNCKNGVLCSMGTNDNVLTLAAHLDTLGGIVRSVKSTGRLRISKIGGWAENTVSGENCTIHTYNNTSITGTIQYVESSVHTSRSVSNEKKEEEIEVVIDEKVFCKEDTLKKGIEVGNFVSFDPRFTVTNTGYIKSRHLDDKAGSVILLAVAKWIQENPSKVQRRIHLYFTTYEEVGHGGSSGVPSETQEMISVDMGAIGNDLTGSEEKVSICVKDSGGPYDYDVTSKLIYIAKANHIPYASDVFPYYGSDVEASLRAGYLIKHGLIGPGVSSSHGYERTHQEGMLNTLLLLLHYIQ
ncbi:MAG: M42 family metallopeptidase [Caldisericia bacterium]|nr:M42 family metallopeptidase [Caldisericia bacterium]MDD4613933.1 M42 family metallopeptidase [Caldisericia bacterium]